MRRSEVLDALPVPESAFVVEIGAGPTPFRRTQLIIDKYPFENTERHGDVLNVAPILKADAVKLPLADRSCDLLFVSHVLEHIDQPTAFLEEARRCATWVYLEFPSRVRELMYAWSFHRWVIDILDGTTLVFHRNDVPQLFGDFFHQNYDFLLDAWSEERFAELNHSLHVETARLAWEFSPLTALEAALRASACGEDKVNYRSRYGATGVGEVSYSRGVLFKTLLWSVMPDRLLRWRRLRQDRVNAERAVELTEAILARMICQRCRAGALGFVDGHSAIVCRSCQARYERERGVFDFDV